MRRYLISPVGEGVGLFVSAVTTVNRFTKEQDFWQIACDVRSSLAKVIKREELYD